MTFRWDVLETRSTTVTICVTGERSQAVDGWTEHHVFSGHEESATWSCSRPPWLVDPNAVGTRTSHLCAGANSTSAGTVDVLGTEPLRIAGAAVETVHLRLTAEVDGVLRGTVVEDRWVEQETGLPVRLRYRARITSSSPAGDSVFRERYELQAELARACALVPRSPLDRRLELALGGSGQAGDGRDRSVEPACRGACAPRVARTRRGRRGGRGRGEGGIGGGASRLRSAREPAHSISATSAHDPAITPAVAAGSSSAIVAAMAMRKKQRLQQESRDVRAAPGGALEGGQPGIGRAGLRSSSQPGSPEADQARQPSHIVLQGLDAVPEPTQLVCGRVRARLPGHGSPRRMASIVSCAFDAPGRGAPRATPPAAARRVARLRRHATGRASAAARRPDRLPTPAPQPRSMAGPEPPTACALASPTTHLNG